MKQSMKFVCLALTLVLAFALSACGAPAANAEATPAATDAMEIAPSAAPEATPSSEATPTIPEETAAAAVAYTPGTYTATAKGNNGDVTVEVTVSADKIENVAVTSHSETAGISDGAITEVPKAIVDTQSLAVDTVSGATVTSNAILAAVEDCLAQAGADVSLLK